MDEGADGARSDEVARTSVIPGSLSKHLFVSPKVPFSQLREDLTDEATARPAHAYSAAGADGLVLRNAGSIAAKLA